MMDGIPVTGPSASFYQKDKLLLWKLLDMDFGVWHVYSFREVVWTTFTVNTCTVGDNYLLRLALQLDFFVGNCIEIL